MDKGQNKVVGGTVAEGTREPKVLEVEYLHVEFVHDGEVNAAVKDVSFSVCQGRTLGIVGESGSGKSVSCLAVMGLLPKSAAVSGHAWLAGASDQPERRGCPERHSGQPHRHDFPRAHDQPKPCAEMRQPGDGDAVGARKS